MPQNRLVGANSFAFQYAAMMIMRMNSHLLFGGQVGGAVVGTVDNSAVTG